MCRGAHYVPRSDKSNREPYWTCYRLTFIKRATERVRRTKREDTQLRAAHDRLERQRGALRREIHQLPPAQAHD